VNFVTNGSITSVQELPRAPTKCLEILLQILCFSVLYANLNFPWPTNEIKDKQKTIELKLQKLEEELKHISSNTLPQSTTSSNEQTITPGIPLSVPSMVKQALSDRKCNIDVYGINEPAPKTEKQARLKQDIKGVLTAFAPINDQLDPSAIKDCFRLGKYNTSHTHPRPLMVRTRCYPHSF